MNLKEIAKSFAKKPEVIEFVNQILMIDWSSYFWCTCLVSLILLFCLYLCTRQHEFLPPAPKYTAEDYFQEDEYENHLEKEKISQNKQIINSKEEEIKELEEMEVEEIELDTNFTLTNEEINQLNNTL